MHPSRVLSEDRIHRVFWHNRFLRGFDSEKECKDAIKFFSSFLIAITYQKGI